VVPPPQFLDQITPLGVHARHRGGTNPDSRKRTRCQGLGIDRYLVWCRKWCRDSRLTSGWNPVPYI